MAGWTERDIPDQRGRTVVVTGANSGLGLCATTALAHAGARVLMACRSLDRGRAALERLGTERAELVRLDLADLSSVAEAAKEITERAAGRVDVLINNAGVMMTPHRRTVDGFELQFGTNHLGHAALTWQLMPALRASGAGRVVTVSSLMAQIGHVDTEDPNFTGRRYLPHLAYGQSKMANLLFMLELDKRLHAAGDPVLSVGAHPGYSATHLQGNMARSFGEGLFANLFAAGAGLANSVFAQPASQGALPELYAATTPDVRGGDFFGPGGFAEIWGPPRRVSVRRARGQERVRERLWNLTAELTGVTPDPV